MIPNKDLEHTSELFKDRDQNEDTLMVMLHALSE